MKYIVLLLLILASCRSAKVEETMTLSIDSTYWRTSLAQLTHADIQDRLQMTAIVETMRPDTTGNLRLTESTKYTVKAERDINYNEEREDTVEHKEESTNNTEGMKNTKGRSDKPPNVDFIFVGIIAIIIIYILRK